MSADDAVIATAVRALADSTPPPDDLAEQIIAAARSRKTTAAAARRRSRTSWLALAAVGKARTAAWTSM